MNIAKLQPANSQVQPMPTDIARVVIRTPQAQVGGFEQGRVARLAIVGSRRPTTLADFIT